EMRISPIGSTVNSSWIILYTGEPPRNYVLAPIRDDPKGTRYIVDELDGILLDHQLEGHVLHSSFAISPNLMHFRCKVPDPSHRRVVDELVPNNQRIAVDMLIYDTSNPRKSVVGSLTVLSYAQRIVQYGNLIKKA